jgi:FkbM family methyltransferase
MVSFIKKILFPHKYLFKRICKANNLSLDFNINKSELYVLKEIFEDRTYSNYFPFYENATVVDIGGHYGYFSLFASLNLHLQSKIFCFEPAKRNFEVLNHNLKSNKIKNVIAENIGIGGIDGELDLFLGQDSNHSLINITNKKERINVKSLQTVLLENNIQIIDFLKIDCEGAEYEILNLLGKEIFHRIKVISLEFHDLKDEKFTANFLVKHLECLGFKIKLFNYSKSYEGKNYGRIVGINKSL